MQLAVGGIMVENVADWVGTLTPVVYSSIRIS